MKLGKLLNHKKWLGLIVVVALVAAYFINRSQANKKDLTTIKPSAREIVETLDVSGGVDAHQKADLRFGAPAKLTWLPVKEGDWVKKWQALAAVDARQLQKQLEYNQNLHGIQFRASENVFDANGKYAGEGMSETERRAVESSELQMRNAALQTEIQDITVKNATMVSPIEGIVTRIDQPNVGANLLVTDVIQVVNPQTVYFAVVVDETDIGKVKVGFKAKITLDAYPDEEFEATVEKIAYVPSQSQSGGLGYKVSLTMPLNEGGQKYRLGMSGDASIILNQKQVEVSIPADAIIERSGVKSVEVVRGGVTEKVTVETGIEDEEYVEITSGLTLIDEVVMPGSK